MSSEVVERPREATIERSASRPSRVLAVAPQPFFSARGTPLSVYYRTLITTQLGIPVDLLTYGQGDDVDIPNVRIFRIPAFRFLGKVKIGPSWLKLFLDVFILFRVIELLIRNRYPVVHAHEESVFFLAFLKRIFGFKLIYDMHSSLPEQLSNYKFTSSRLLIGTFEKLEQACLDRADAVITICPELARYAEPRMPDPTRQILIENSIFDDVQIARSSATAGPSPPVPVLPEGRRLIVYAGTFEAYQGLEIVLSALPEVVRGCPEAFLVLVGGQPDQVARLQALAEQRGVSAHCSIMGRLPVAVANALNARADVLVSPRSTGSNTPLKIYQLLASGIPIVATRVLSHTQVLDDDVCILVDPEPASMAAGLLKGLTDEAERGRISANAVAFYQREYARDAYTRKMTRLFELVS